MLADYLLTGIAGKTGETIISFNTAFLFKRSNTDGISAGGEGFGELFFGVTESYFHLFTLIDVLNDDNHAAFTTEVDRFAGKQADKDLP